MAKTRCLICGVWLTKNCFKFPIKRAEICGSWREFSHVAENYVIKNSDGLCVKHFRTEDFSSKEPPPVSPVSSPPVSRLRLLLDAVPSLHKPQPHQAICVTPPCRVIKKPDHASLMQQTSPTQDVYFQLKAQYSALSEKCKGLQSSIDSLLAENSEMKRKLAKLEETEEKLAKLHEYVEDISQNAMSMENAYNETLFQLTRIKDKLAETWSENQIRLFIGEIKKVKIFDYRALARAAFMRIIGNKKLTFIRGVTHLPIPCETTIKSFIRKLQLGPGLVIFALDLLSIKLLDAKSLAEKFLIFYIDATPLNGKYRYNEETGKIESEYAVYEIKVASLLGTFSQTIFYDFYMPSSEQLLELFSAIRKLGGFPCLFSSDSHSQNLKTYNYLIARSYQQEKFINQKQMLTIVPNWFFFSNDKKPDFLQTQADMDGHDDMLNVEEDLKNNMKIYLNLDQCHNLRGLLEHLRKGQVYTVEDVDLSIKPLKMTQSLTQALTMKKPREILKVPLAEIQNRQVPAPKSTQSLTQVVTNKIPTTKKRAALTEIQNSQVSALKKFKPNSSSVTNQKPKRTHMRFNSMSSSEGERGEKISEYDEITKDFINCHHVSFAQLEDYVAEIGDLKASKTSFDEHEKAKKREKRPKLDALDALDMLKMTAEDEDAQLSMSNPFSKNQLLHLKKSIIIPAFGGDIDDVQFFYDFEPWFSTDFLKQLKFVVFQREFNMNESSTSSLLLKQQREIDAFTKKTFEKMREEEIVKEARRQQEEELEEIEKQKSKQKWRENMWREFEKKHSLQQRLKHGNKM